MTAPRGSGPGTIWAPWQIAKLRRLYGKMPTHAVCVRVQRTRKAVEMMAWKLRLGKRRYRGKRIGQERYETFMGLTAAFNGVPAKDMFRDLRRHESELSAIKFAAWAALRDDGITCTSIASVAGVDHTSVLYGIRRHAQMAAREAAE